MTERGTTGTGRPQIGGVPRVHRFRKLDGRGTTERGTTGAGKPGIAGVPRVRPTLRLDGRGTGNIIPLGQTSGIRSLTHSGLRPSTPRALIHGSMVTDGAK